ncbi:MAG: hypothetical protein ABIZ07_12205 [Dermatophilaceae bacterium]
MDTDQPGLFELPDGEPLPPAEKLQRGRNREVWALTVTAEVTIIDADALTEAATLANEGFVVTGLEADLDVEDSEPVALPAENGSDAFDALAWLIWPTRGLEGVLDIGAARIRSVDSEVAVDSEDRCTATWRATVKLTDVDRLRRLAARAHPDESALISDSLAVALQRAIDPFAPFRGIPGIIWHLGRVVVEHLPAIPARHR